MGNTLAKAAFIDMGLQWALFLIAAYFKTEKFYDLAGSSTFILLAVQSLLSNRKLFPRQVVQSSLVCMWAVRLGLFLLVRVLRSGQDSRFNRVRDNPKIFFIYWTVQGLWVWLTLLPTLIVNSKQTDTELCTRDYIGWGVWMAGMVIECIADYQKYSFRSNAANKDKWISHGLWGIVRHPNYLGEIMLWLGLFISASSTFKGKEYLSVLSPIFVAFLLTRVSGIPILERQNWKKWKETPQYLQYVQSTPKLIPFLY